MLSMAMSQMPDNNGAGKSEEETMRFAMIGEDHSTDLEKLEKYTGEVDWNYIKPHFLSGALLYVDPALSLTEVGRAFAEDQVEKVKAWRKVGDLVTPSQPHADYWESSDAKFIALVVSPFVLVQPVAGEQDGKKAEKSVV